MKRKIISLLLALVLLVSVMPAALAAEGSFTDIKDEETAQAAEILRQLGVVDGVGGSKFNPEGNLKRAEFCKMAVVMMGIEDQEASYRSRTIFTDVDSRHWARGYINLAAAGPEAFISGMGNGKFAPNDYITFAQAVTILVRLLGYSDSDTNMQWPEGYMTLADTVGLTEKFDIAPGSVITRAQAARLFAELLICQTKSGSAYLSRFGSVTEKVIILSNDAVASDGSLGAVYTSAGSYKTDVPVADSTIGKRGTIAAKDGKLIVFIPTDTTSMTFSVSLAESGWFKTSEGTRYTVDGDTTVYTEDEKSVWNEVWLDMPAGSNITVYFDAKGSIEAIFFATSAADGRVAVAMNEVKGNPFTSVLGAPADCEIYKNGAPATAADIRQYDVAEYDKAAKQLRINDTRLTGTYENAYPGTAAPEQIKVLGRLWDVIPSAWDSLGQFKLGDTMTLLFTSDMRVAGAVSPREADSTAVGVVTAFGGGNVSVELLSVHRKGIVISGKAVKNSTDLQGELVTVAGIYGGEISVRPLSAGIRAEKINIADMTYGSIAISPAVKIFDRAGKGMPVSVSVSDLPETLAKADVLYAGTDYAGRVGMLILNDVTGNGYIYGATTVTSRKNPVDDSVQYNLKLVNGEKSISVDTFPINVVKDNSYGGVVLSTDGTRVLAAVQLTRINGVGRSDFKTEGDETTVTIDGVTYPVADNVQCYNAAAGEWFKSLDDARRFAASLTVYYDRDPAKGGKIRIVVAE